MTSSLPRKCSTTELCGLFPSFPAKSNASLPAIYKRVMGIEPTLSAWKAEVLPLNYTRTEPLTLSNRHYISGCLFCQLVPTDESASLPLFSAFPSFHIKLVVSLPRYANTSLLTGDFLIVTSPVEGVGFEPTKAEPSDLQSDPFDHSGTPPKKSSRAFSPKVLALVNYMPIKICPFSCFFHPHLNHRWAMYHF